jgi:DNA polymerase III delta prime subunit
MAVTPVQQTVYGDHNIVAGTGDIRIIHQLSPADTEDRRNLSLLLEDVKNIWIEGVLRDALHNRGMLDLAMQPMTDAVENPLGRTPGLPDQDSQSLPLANEIIDIFHEAQRALLILGKPGSGKTTTLLRLARDLIPSAADVLNKPIPVVFNLSSWTNSQKPIFSWLVDELKSQYRVSPSLGRRWLEEHRLIPLLDGLDEVRSDHRTACVNAINEFAQGYGISGLVVCSRLGEYTTLRPVRLKLNGAIYLQPLTSEQVNAYLVQAGAPLAALQSTLQEDGVLQSVVESPLMLTIMSETYKDAPTEALASHRLDTVEKSRERIFDAYIESMFRRRGKAEQPYTKAQTLVWLSWLGKKMLQQSQSIFLIEQLQPSWLASPWDQRLYILVSRLVAGFLFGLALAPMWEYGGVLSGLLLGFSVGILDLLWLTQNVSLTNKLQLSRFWLPTMKVLIVSLVGWCFGSVFWPNEESPFLIQDGLVRGLVFGSIMTLRNGRENGTEDIRTVETLRWSWARARKVSIWVFSAGSLLVYLLFSSISPAMLLVPTGLLLLPFLFFIVHGVFLGRSGSKTLSGRLLGVSLNRAVHIWATFAFLSGLTAMLLALIIERSSVPFHVLSLSVDKGVIIFDWPLLVGLMLSLVGVLPGGLMAGVVAGKSLPNEGVYLSARSAVKVGLMMGLAALLSAILVYCLLWIVAFASIHEGIQFALSELRRDQHFIRSGVWYAAVCIALWYGGLDVINHYILRSLLVIRRDTPPRYADFLDYGVKLVFLQRVGGGYIFIHRLLLEHFAAMAETNVKTPPLKN